MAHGDNMVARLNLATGNPTTTTFLLRLEFWSRLSKTVEDDARWVTNDQADWSVECGLTHRQIRRIFDQAKKDNLIATRFAWFGGRRCLQTALTDRARRILTGALALKEADHLPLKGQTTCPLKGSSYIHGEKHGETHGEKQHPAVGGLPYCEPEKEKCGVKGKNENMKYGGSMKGVEGAVKAQKVLHKPDSVQGLVSIWCNHMAEIEGHVIVALPKHKGQLANFLKACPPLRAETALQTILDNWKAVCAAIQDVAGVETNPYKPSLNYLLKYSDIAISYALSNKPSGPVPQQEVAPASNMQLTAKDDPDEKAAQAAILGIKWEKK